MPLKKFQLFFVVLLIIFSTGCSKAVRNPQDLTLGLDQTWYPLDLEGKQANVNGFIGALLRDIQDDSLLKIQTISMSWDNLVLGLHQRKYQMILSSIPTTSRNKKLYDFSDVILPTGPVLVVAIQHQSRTIEKMPKDALIAVKPRTPQALYVETHPHLFPKYYSSHSSMMQAVSKGEVQGALIPVIPAISYTQNLFQGQLVIVGQPLFHEGIRLVTLKNQNTSLFDEFSKALKKLKNDKATADLLKKWGVGL